MLRLLTDAARCELCGDGEDAPQHQPPRRYGYHEFRAALPPEIMTALDGVAEAMGLTLIPEGGGVRPASMSYVTPSELVERVRSLVTAKESAERDTERLDVLDNYCRRIAIHPVNGAEGGGSVFRWQIDARGDLSRRPSIRDAIDRDLAKLPPPIPPEAMERAGELLKEADDRAARAVEGRAHAE